MTSMSNEIELAVGAMLPCQQEVIARAALAGVRFKPVKEHVSERWVDADSQFRKRNIVRTHYKAVLPSGQVWGYFDDIYEAACSSLAYLTQTPVEGDVSFALYPDNEQ